MSKLMRMINFIREHPDENLGRIIFVSTSNHPDLNPDDSIDMLYQHVKTCLLCRAEVMAIDALMERRLPEEERLREEINEKERSYFLFALICSEEFKSEFLKRVEGT